MVGYLFVSDPNGWGNWSLTIFQTGSGFSVAVSMGAYLNKRLPKMIRGMMLAVISASSSVGSIIYLQLY
jgi:hypothetical protein